MSSLFISNVFQASSVFQEVMKFLELADIVRVKQVCKSWDNLIENSPLIWKQLFENEGIPLVISLDGKPRDYKQDFKILYPITVSGKKISQFLGEMVGGVPPISEKWVLKLKEKDPFEVGKSIGENYVFVVVPNLLKRTVDQATYLDVDQSGDLFESRIKRKKDLTIPFSLKNLKVLCSYPLKGKKNSPVFDEYNKTIFFDQCNTCPDKVRVYFMRKHIAKESGKWGYDNKVKVVKEHAFEVTPLFERALFDSIKILESGTCPDDSHVTTSDIVHYAGMDFHVAIGKFVPRVGLSVDYDYDSYGSGLAVVPGAPAGVLQQ